MLKLLHNRYEFVKQCGSGGAGVVFEARDIRLRRSVAVKRVHTKGGNREIKAALLLNEGRNLARLDHPNVVTIHDILEGETSISIVMELVPGEPIRELFRKKPVPEREFLATFRQLLEALEAVHAAGLIHRDVNPKNVLLTPEGKVKLTDFGLSVDVKETNPRAGGNVGYMAPEALRKNARVSFGVDIYAAGFLAYQALLGLPGFKRFYGASSPREWARWMLSREKFRTLVDLGAPVSPALSSIIRKMLEKDTKERYAKVSSVLQDLDILRARSRQRAAAEEPSAPSGVRRLLPSRRAAREGEAAED